MAYVVSNLICEMACNILPAGQVAHIGTSSAKGVILRGVRTSNENKLMMAVTCRVLLQREHIVFWKHFVCCGKRGGLKDREDRVEDVLSIFRDQMNHMRQYTKFTNGMHGFDTVFISGKGGGRNDDLALAFMLGAHWSQAHMKGHAELAM